MKKLNKFILSLGMLGLGFIATSVDVKADTYGDYEYEINPDGKTVTITSYNREDEDNWENAWWEDGAYSITIPSRIDNRTVTVIAGEAFKDRQTISSIVMPSGLTEIAASAFEGMQNLKKVVFYNNLKTIGNCAFKSCDQLSSAEFPDSLEVIGSSAFEDTNLTSFRITRNVYKIDGSSLNKYVITDYDTFSSTPVSVSVDSENPYYECLGNSNAIVDKNKLSLVWGNSITTIPDKVKTIGKYAFYGVDFENYNIPEQIYAISYGAFKKCEKLESVYMGNNVVSIGDEAFDGCKMLNYIQLSNSIKKIGEGAFAGCESLTSINIPESVTNIGNYAFESCYNLSSVYLPSKLLNISKGMFVYCYALSGIELPENVTCIDDDAFSYCEGLKGIKITSKVGNIGDSAFSDSGIEKLEIPGSVREIGCGIVSGCYGLEGISVASSNKYYDSRNNCNAIIDKSTNTLISGCKKTIIPNSVKIIARDSFYRCMTISSVTIPQSVVQIESLAFGECSNLKKVVIRNKKIDIGDSAFYEPSENLVIYCYKDSSALQYAKYYKIGYSILKEEKTDITKAAAKTKITGVINKTYTGKLLLQPELAVTVNGHKLKLNTDYTLKYLNNKNIGMACVTVVAKGKYTGSITKKYKIYIPVGKTFVVGAMKYRVTDPSINGLGQVAVVGSKYSRTSKKLKSVSIASKIVIGNMKYNVTSIDKNAFKNCKYLNCVTIGAGIKKIGDCAFENSHNLSRITINTLKLTKSSIGKKTFKGIKSNATIKLPKKKYKTYVRLMKSSGISQKVKFK